MLDLKQKIAKINHKLLRGGGKMLSKEQLESYWRENRNLMVVVLIIWALVSYGAALISGWLNKVVIFGFPLGYYMGAQGALIVFLLLIIFYSKKMDEIDKKYGVEEE
jgi:putative solute:sodium symporter small subunit